MLALQNFRNLNEVDKFLTQIDKELEDDDQELKRYERLFATLMEGNALKRIRASAAFQAVAVRTFNVQHPQKNIKQLHQPMPNKRSPQIKKLSQDFQLIENLTKKLKTLDILEIRIREDFTGDRKLSRTLKTIKEERKLILEKLAQTQQLVTEIAKKKIPNKYQLEDTYIAKRFLKNIKGKYENAKSLLYLNSYKTDEGMELQFTYVLQIWKLQAGDFTYPVFYIVITHILDPRGEAKSYITTQTNFISPYSKSSHLLNRGNQYKSKADALHILGAEMEMDGFVGLFNADTVPIEEERLAPNLFRQQRYIKDIKVEKAGKSEVLVFTLIPEAKENIEDILKSLMADMRGLLEEDKEKNTFLHKVNVKSKNPTITFKFLRDPSRGVKNVRIGQHFVKQMQDQFDLSDHQTRVLVRFLSGGSNG